MGLADYFGRSAVAAGQVLAGYDERAIRERLDTQRIGLQVGPSATTAEGRALTDLIVRLLARLYPSLVIQGRGADGWAAELADLARAINPAIELDGAPTLVLGVGDDVPGGARALFAGSTGWTALFSRTAPQPVGTTNNPFGAGTSACIAAANLFRAVFFDDADARMDRDAAFHVLPPGRVASDFSPLRFDGRAALVGVGAVGNAAVWALARSGIEGPLELVDGEQIDLGNLQRYAMATRADVGRSKVDVAAAALGATWKVSAVVDHWARFVAERGVPDRVLVALDSARDRRAVQAALPRWLANAWTQPGDLGVSTHDFLNGACLACLYLPTGTVENADQIVARALGIPERLLEVRQLLDTGAPTPRPLIEAVSAAHGVRLEDALAFEGRPLRALYVEGVCGGVLLPIGATGAPRAEVHVPLAHQSALAGVLLAAEFVAQLVAAVDGTHVLRLDVLRPLPEFVRQRAAKDPRGICICQDPDYVASYRAMYFPD
jgi:hypothetical protein